MVDLCAMFKIDLIVWKCINFKLYKYMVLVFKIDLIVWKYEFLADRIEFIDEFKIDLIVWKCGIINHEP